MSRQKGIAPEGAKQDGDEEEIHQNAGVGAESHQNDATHGGELQEERHGSSESCRTVVRTGIFWPGEQTISTGPIMASGGLSRRLPALPCGPPSPAPKPSGCNVPPGGSCHLIARVGGRARPSPCVPPGSSSRS